jgi:hypothetical protein
VETTIKGGRNTNAANFTKFFGMATVFTSLFYVRLGLD